MTELTRPRIAVIDYGIGNLRSAQKALERAGAEAALTTDVAEIAKADAVVLPGVGAMGRCMEALAKSGLRGATLSAAASGRPFLGICVGMQMLHEGSDEFGGVEGLGIMPGVVRLIPGDVKRPQMQWNVVNRMPDRPSWLLGPPTESSLWVYFVHSFAPEAHPFVVGTCDYGSAVTAAVERDNVAGTQFHPEKSSDVGISLLGNFVRRCTLVNR